MSERRIRIYVLLLGATAFLVFFCSPIANMSDSKYSMLTAESLLCNGTPDLSSYAIPEHNTDLPFNKVRGTHAYQLQQVNGRLLYGFPHGTSLLSVPFVAAFDLIGISAATPDRRFNLRGEIILQKVLAALLMAAFVMISMRAALLLLDWKWSLAIAAGTGLGSQVWSVASRGMWSHTWAITLALGAVYLLLKSEVRGGSIRPLILGTLLAWSYFARPTGAVAALFVAIYVLLRKRDDFALLAVTGLSWLAASVLYTLCVFGTAVPIYDGAQGWDPGSLGVALYGNLFGPSRGLFVYDPVLAVVFYWVLYNWVRLISRPLAGLALAIVTTLTLVSAANRVWWGGNCFGSRYLTDAVPWIVLLAIMAVEAIGPERRGFRDPATTVGCVALVLSVAINAVGAFSVNAMNWSMQGAGPSLMLDWSRPQLLAPWQKVVSPRRQAGKCCDCGISASSLRQLRPSRSPRFDKVRPPECSLFFYARECGPLRSHDD